MTKGLTQSVALGKALLACLTVFTIGRADQRLPGLLERGPERGSGGTSPGAGWDVGPPRCRARPIRCGRPAPAATRQRSRAPSPQRARPDHYRPAGDALETVLVA